MLKLSLVTPGNVKFELLEKSTYGYKNRKDKKKNAKSKAATENISVVLSHHGVYT